MYGSSIRPQAAACLRGGADTPNLRGKVQFYQRCGSVFVTVHVFGLPEENPSGFFGLHIHEGYGCGGEALAEPGGHYDPAGMPYPRHAGDLPPLLSCGGEAYLAVKTDRFSVRDVLGRTVVIHSGADDFHTQPAGNAGTKIACGVIRPVL